MGGFYSMVSFSRGEVRDLLISMVVLSFAFAFFFRNDFEGNFLVLVPAMMIAVVPGFAFHELAHKFMAIKYGFDAEYRLWWFGLILAVFSSFFSVIFAVPGAIYIKGDKVISEVENGKISVVGPLINILLAFLFLFMAIVIAIIGFIFYPNADGTGFTKTLPGFIMCLYGVGRFYY
jgi:Zn-dependent protease